MNARRTEIDREMERERKADEFKQFKKRRKGKNHKRNGGKKLKIDREVKDYELT